MTSPLSLPAIRAHWIATLCLPPTAQVSNLRRLVRIVTRDRHPALTPLFLAALCPLYLDLALAYAFLGEYHLASTVFKEAVDNDATNPVAWFALGLAQAELGKWRHAKRSWKNCLLCFESAGGQQEDMPYVLFQTQDHMARGGTAWGPKVGLKSGVWTLERTRVGFNYRVALRETGSKELGLAPRAADEKRPGLNGIPAELRFGPGWDASLQSSDSPALAQQSSSAAELGDEASFGGNPQPVAQAPTSSGTFSPNAAAQTHISSHRPLPPLPRPPGTPIPSLADKDSFNDHRPSVIENPFITSPERDASNSLISTSSHTPTTTRRQFDARQERFSRSSTLIQDLDERSDDDNDETLIAIDNTIASWRGVGQKHGDQNQSSMSDDHIATAIHSPSSQSDTDDHDGEILQPRVFEGFRPRSQQEL